MRYRFKHHLPFLFGAVVALTLAILLVRIRYELEMLRQHSHAQDQVYATAGEVAARLYRIARRPSAGIRPAHDWHQWQMRDNDFVETTAPVPVGEAVLRNARDVLRTEDRWRLRGPFGTEQGRNVLVVEIPGRASTSDGDWFFADELLPDGPLIEWLRKGYRLQLLDESDHAALYQSDEGPVSAPVVASVPFGNARLSLRASPKEGWRVPPSYLSSCLLVATAVVMWLTYELRRSHTLRNALEQAEQSDIRRREANEHYGDALQSLAALESKLHVASMFDSVTGMANRASLLHRIEGVLGSMRRGSRGTLSVMAIGFEHSHHITNSFGAEFAARVLVVAAQRLELVLHSKQPLFLTGEFQLAVVPPQGEPGSCEKIAQQIVAEIEAPIVLDGHTFLLHPSIGVAETVSGYDDAEALLDKANVAMGAVRHDAQIRYCFFDSATSKDSASRLQLVADLGRAFEENQFTLEFEPLVVPASREVAGFEALIQWDHPTEGRIEPGRFIPIAVEAGMSHRLNGWFMRESVRQASIWHHGGYPDLFINFNMSADAFLRPQLAEEVASVLAEFDLPGRNLVIELTESTLIQDIRAASRTLARLDELEVGAWLDDFGSGYSSLSHLRELPLKGVKIDRSFVNRSVIDARDFGFLKALIDLISYLGMQSIVSGVDTHEQHELLTLTSCQLYQGRHFGRSMPAPQAERWMQQSGRLAREGMTA